MRSPPEIFTLGHSPDPDDAFMFYAMAENKIDLRGYRFEHHLEDIQTLNERALRGELHISAISIHAYPYVADKYLLLPCGASMGDGYGPILIRKRPTSLREATARQAPKIQRRTSNSERSAFEVECSKFDVSSSEDLREWLRNCLIAVPGRMTSAYVALQLYLGEFRHVVIPFDQIFEAVKQNRVDAGLIIHEGQLTYAKSGFERIVDLGKWWKEETGLPLPLGGNVLRKDIPSDVRHDLVGVIRQSIDYGLAHRDEAVQHSMAYARDMNTQLAGQFIGMYVNEFTRDYGGIGRAAIRKFLGEAQRAAYIDHEFEIEFAD
jgi:1,4-dihydroxy-6-naphthoate synthase